MRDVDESNGSGHDDLVEQSSPAPGLRTIRPHDARNITGQVLMFVGADIPGIADDERAAHRSWQTRTELLADVL